MRMIMPPMRKYRSIFCSQVCKLKIVYLPMQPGDVLPPVPILVGKGGAYAMSTYEELQLIVSVALLIVSILNYVKRNNKK